MRACDGPSTGIRPTRTGGSAASQPSSGSSTARTTKFPPRSGIENADYRNNAVSVGWQGGRQEHKEKIDAPNLNPFKHSSQCSMPSQFHSTFGDVASLQSPRTFRSGEHWKGYQPYGK